VAERHLNDWTKFSVGTVSNRSNWTNPDCVPLETVTHVSHIETALAIGREMRIRAGLIYDESRLNTDRILVVWMSPNDWYLGSRYGNIAYEFEWKSMIEGRRFFWVGAMTQYSPAALRILITNQDYSQRGLKEYDPTGSAGKGPWWIDPVSGIHYWNGQYTLEFMVEDDVLLSSCQNLSFKKHNPGMCSQRPYACNEKGLDASGASARFLAGVVTRLSDLGGDDFLVDNNVPTALLQSAFTALDIALNGRKEPPPTGQIRASDPEARALVRGALAAFYSRRDAEWRQIRKMFRSVGDFTGASKSLVEDHFDLPSGSL